MAEAVQAYKSAGGKIFATEAEAERYDIIEAAAAVIAPQVDPAAFNEMTSLRVVFTKQAIEELYDKCGWRPVS